MMNNDVCTNRTEEGEVNNGNICRCLECKNENGENCCTLLDHLY